MQNKMKELDTKVKTNILFDNTLNPYGKKCINIQFLFVLNIKKTN